MPVAPPENSRNIVAAWEVASLGIMLPKPVQWNSNNKNAERSKTIFIDKMLVLMMMMMKKLRQQQHCSVVHLFFNNNKRHSVDNTQRFKCCAYLCMQMPVKSVHIGHHTCKNCYSNLFWWYSANLRIIDTFVHFQFNNYHFCRCFVPLSFLLTSALFLFVHLARSPAQFPFFRSISGKAKMSTHDCVCVKEAEIYRQMM